MYRRVAIFEMQGTFSSGVTSSPLDALSKSCFPGLEEVSSILQLGSSIPSRSVVWRISRSPSLVEEEAAPCFNMQLSSTVLRNSPSKSVRGRGQETKTSAPILYLTPANHLYQIMQSVRVTGPARQIVTPFFIQ